MLDVSYRHWRRRTMAVRVRRARRAALRHDRAYPTFPGLRWLRRLLGLLAVVVPLLGLQTALALYDDMASAGQGSYVVQAGDTLSSIALANGLSVAQLVELNSLADPDVIAVGQRLRLAATAPATPASGGGYVVQPGDTLFGIARATGVSVSDLAAWNRIDDANVIAVGQTLRTSGPSSSAATRAGRLTAAAGAASVTKVTTKNRWTGRPYGPPIAIVLHTADGSLTAMDSWFQNPWSEHSAHFGIGLDGKVHQYVELTDRAWANGGVEARSTWPGPAGINPNHITVSIETEDRGDATQPVTEAQYQATLAVARMALKQYPSIRYLVTHRAIAPETRAVDPGARWMRSGRFAALASDLGLEPIP